MVFNTPYILIVVVSVRILLTKKKIKICSKYARKLLNYAFAKVRTNKFVFSFIFNMKTTVSF